MTGAVKFGERVDTRKAEEEIGIWENVKTHVESVCVECMHKFFAHAEGKRLEPS